MWLFWRGFRIPRRTSGALALRRRGRSPPAALYFSPLGQHLRSRARWFAEDPWGGARPLLWRDSLRMGLARPLAGHGPETFTATFPHYESTALARAYPDFAHESPHNIFLDALVAQGIAGLLLLAAWCALGFAAAWKIRGKNPDTGRVPGCRARRRNRQPAVHGLHHPHRRDLLRHHRAGRGPGRFPAMPRRAASAASRSPCPLLYFAVRIAFADHALALTQRDLAAGDLTAAAAHYQASGQTSDLWYSRALLDTAGKAPTLPFALPAFQLAVAAGERATRTAEDPFNAWYSLSAIRAGQNDAAGTERCLRAAIAAHPTWFKPHWTLAQVLRLESRGEEAAREAALAADLDGGKHPEVARTLQEFT